MFGAGMAAGGGVAGAVKAHGDWSGANTPPVDDRLWKEEGEDRRDIKQEEDEKTKRRKEVLRTGHGQRERVTSAIIDHSPASQPADRP
jgi:hypothetical protein